MIDSPHITWSDDGRGFATTAPAYREFVRSARLRPMAATQIRRLREGADIVAVGAVIRTAFCDAEIPPGVVAAIEEAYQKLGGADVELQVSGTAAGEPLDEFFTGPQEVFLHVTGLQALLAACKRCWASLYNDRAIIYREVRDIDQLSVDLCVVARPMTDLDFAADTIDQVLGRV
ncbi:pyruvate phosphate dikinase-like enzyme [Kribbella orskensis]|uniref:Phosphoenolpyruvate synthase n=1 Tax=Kribbella orskensis TaxID=2512216 RepID=A0ABY2B7V3_9ACTN|nr:MULTISPECIES: PEP/pyruvate-binding domain-containing protein [Kribbella]TCN27056.1 pyruvate phosphate dikinase-like enzyme [Kribbella sp. VKM Ac-2500]TCO07514.1 pyruvate phosphate dikinase-like enzyme [Kribbella orskensis]